MRRLIIQADVNGTRLDPSRVVQRSALGSCDCRYAGRRIPLLARPVYMQGRAQSARNPPSPESLLATRGPQCALEPLPNPICVQNVKMTPNAK